MSESAGQFTMTKRVVISCGAIPSNIDSVKFITNRFRGGLAFKTAQFLSQFYEVTVVKWKFTDYVAPEGIKIVNITNVYDYFEWFQQNSVNYDAFVLAGAVANLTPTHPFEGKFPSHLYKVGDKFNIEFEIAPRAIDVIKQINPRCCLIGYKLFDAQTDEELIEIGRHTLNDARANCVFANTPAEAKSRKIALMQDGASIPMSFDEHLVFLKDLIDAQYFRTEIVNIEKPQDDFLKGLVSVFEKSFDKFGTVAFKSYDGEGIVTTSRGHRSGAVYVQRVDFENRIIYATDRATLNAPLLFQILQNSGDFVVHRHSIIDSAPTVPYELPGTLKEVALASQISIAHCPATNILNHGFVQVHNYSAVDWSAYYDQFPSKYFDFPPIMDEFLARMKARETIEIGGNSRCQTKYLLDPNVQSSIAQNVTYDDLKRLKFDLILLKNSIAYLTQAQLDVVLESRKPDGVIIANVFGSPPELKVTENEVSVLMGDQIVHHLVVGDRVIRHAFFARNEEFYRQKGFAVTRYGKNSLLLVIQPE
jgi:hypothetical protein